MSQDLIHLESKEGEERDMGLPFPWTHSFKLLGVTLDCHWHFREHFHEVQKKAAGRLQIVRRAGGAISGMERRVVAISSHALVETIVDYGRAT